jgi:hypothetical protein
MTTPNPDFSLDSKKRIAKAVRRVEGMSNDYTNVKRPAYPRGGGGLPKAQYTYQVLTVGANNQWVADFMRLNPEL